MQNLIARFGRAGLDLQLPRTPIRRMTPKVFQMDIERTRGSERFRIWKGDEVNRVEVVSVDRKLNQLILFIKEPGRWFPDRLSKRVHRNRPQRTLDFKVIGEDRWDWFIQRRTSDAERRFLCGMDERHLFIAQVRKGSHVRAAHRDLKPEEVRDAESSGRGPALRQGEWFFVRPHKAEMGPLEQAVVRKRTSLGGNGRPHVADEVVKIGDRTYARGAVRHPEHKTLRLDSWRRVYRNTEVQESLVGRNGIFWID